MPVFTKAAKAAAKPAPSPTSVPSKLAKQSASTSTQPLQSSHLESTPEHLTQQSLKVLREFLAYADQEAASLLPLSDTTDTSLDEATEPEIPIPQWNVLYSTASATTPSSDDAFASSIVVRSHPDPNRHLFSVQSVIPGVTARQFWSLMASAENRKLWDNTVEEGSVKRWLANELAASPSSSVSTETANSQSSSSPNGSSSADIAESLAARVELLRFGSIFMVAKARDMVLLSVDARLPPKSLSSDQSPEDGPLRLVSTSQSIVDPSLPPRKGYTRFELRTGGFMVEDLGDDGVPESACVATAPPLSLPEPSMSPSSSKGSHLVKGLRALGRRNRSVSSSSANSRHGRNISDSSEPPQSPSLRPKAPLRDPRGPAVLVTQVSDLGEMAAWVPASVIKMVASTLVPRSLASVAKVAKTMQVSQALYQNHQPKRNDEAVKSTTIAVDQLGKGSGEWYQHRILPAMVGRGALRRPSPPAIAAALPASKSIASISSNSDAQPVATATPKPMSPETLPVSRLSDVPEVASSTPVSPKMPLHTEADTSTSATPPLTAPAESKTTEREAAPVDTPIEASEAAATTSPTKVTTLPPRTSSLPGSPVPNRASPLFPGSPNKPMSPGSPLGRPNMLIDLRGLAPPTFPGADRMPGRSRGATPISPGMYTDSDAGHDDLLSSSTSSLATSAALSPARIRQRFMQMTPSEGTETVPGSVAASELDELSRDGDYLSKGRNLDQPSYGITGQQFRRATLNLANNARDGHADADTSQQEILSDHDDAADATIRQPWYLPSSSSAMTLHRGKTAALATSPPPSSFSPGSPMSPAEKRSRMLSNEYFAAHLDPDFASVSSSKLASISFGKGQGRKPDNEQDGTQASGLDRKIRRLSNALAAEMERRQFSQSGFSPRSFRGQPLPNIDVQEQLRESTSASADANAHVDGNADLVAMLADALTESLPFVAENAGQQNHDQVKEQARRVSAMLLVGSDALALSLAPGARESLGLQFDGLSTPSEHSEPATPAEASPAGTPLPSPLRSHHAEPASTPKPKSTPTMQLHDTIKAGGVQDASPTKSQTKRPANLGVGSGDSGMLHPGTGSGADRRSRKPSINSESRSISISAAQADVSACTESVISLGGARHSTATAAVLATPDGRGDQIDVDTSTQARSNNQSESSASASSLTQSSHCASGVDDSSTPASSASTSVMLSHSNSTSTKFAKAAKSKSGSELSTASNSNSSRGAAGTIGSGRSSSRKDTRAIESLREISRASRRSVRPVRRHLGSSSASAPGAMHAHSASSGSQAGAQPGAPAGVKQRPGYGAYLLGGLAYYSGYSWYTGAGAGSGAGAGAGAGAGGARVQSLPSGTGANVGGGGGGLVRPISTSVSGTGAVGAGRVRIPSVHSIGRRRSRANYRLENNAKLHPFPGSLSKRTGMAAVQNGASSANSRPLDGSTAGTSQGGNKGMATKSESGQLGSEGRSNRSLSSTRPSLEPHRGSLKAAEGTLAANPEGPSNKAVMASSTAALPPPIQGFGVGKMKRFPTHRFHRPPNLSSGPSTADSNFSRLENSRLPHAPGLRDGEVEEDDAEDEDDGDWFEDDPVSAGDVGGAVAAHEGRRPVVTGRA
ncbi:hypothetical protein BCV70DRAFT_198830 [Testicularia cyperi]|uniref:START domain-containing protein n=1 Tax=Testicularia cyperi TaxID=1882483 RepID=A0A317XU49_9BASI|nr:hypothetical protein BCV70DRAFT_198830 [Testicularia cyperi]